MSVVSVALLFWTLQKSDILGKHVWQAYCYYGIYQLSILCDKIYQYDLSLVCLDINIDCSWYQSSSEFDSSLRQKCRFFEVSNLSRLIAIFSLCLQQCVFLGRFLAQTDLWREFLLIANT